MDNRQAVRESLAKHNAMLDDLEPRVPLDPSEIAMMGAWAYASALEGIIARYRDRNAAQAAEIKRLLGAPPAESDDGRFVKVGNSVWPKTTTETH